MLSEAEQEEALKPAPGFDCGAWAASAAGGCSWGRWQWLAEVLPTPWGSAADWYTAADYGWLLEHCPVACGLCSVDTSGPSTGVESTSVQSARSDALCCENR